MAQHLGLLLKRLGLIMGVYTGFRLVFYALNHHQFVNNDLVDIGFAFIHGLRFDLSSILITNIFFILFSILPGNLINKSSYQSFLKVLFIVVNFIFIFVNMADSEYYKFTGKRINLDVVDLSGEMAAQLDQFIVNYWHLDLLGLIFFIILSFLIAPNISFAGGYQSKSYGRTGYLKKDRLDPDRTNIYDRNGSRKGYLKQDRLFKDRTYIYDRDGRKKGYIKQDRLFKDQTNIYDRDGGREGYLKKDRLDKDRTNIFNQDGSREGYLKQDNLFEDRTNIFND